MFKIGQLVTFDPCVKSIEGTYYTTCSWNTADQYWLYEKIDMSTFPSWSDFHGYRVSVKRGDRCLVLESLGIPEGLLYYSFKKPDIDMNVYSVLINSRTVEVFGCDSRL